MFNESISVSAFKEMIVDVIIPAFDEENAIGKVINDIPKDLVREIVVCNNASKDRTETVAKQAGATVLLEERKGYGYACLKGIDYLRAKGEQQPDILVFIDGDYSDYPEQIPELLDPILNNDIDMVIGSRALGDRQSKSMTPQQVFGNWLSTKLMRLFYNAKFTDLGPFRAIRFNRLLELGMSDKTYGWTIEMQIKAIKMGLNYTEVPVNYRPRIGFSKVSGTLKGTLMAGYKIINTIFKYL